MDVEDLSYWYISRGHGRFGQDIGSGAATVQGIGFSGKRQQVRSVRTREKCRSETNARQLVVSCEKDADRLDRLDRCDRRDPRSPAKKFLIALITSVTVLTCQLAETFLLARLLCRCATCAMGMMGMFKWLRKDITHRERTGWNLAKKQCSLNNESYRNALQAFIERRRCSDDVEIDAPCSPDKARADLAAKNNNKKYDNEWKSQQSTSIFRGIPCVPASELFEVGCIAGTEDRYLELIFAEWQNTRVTLKRHIHPECKDAVRADLDVLVEIPHPNLLLLMGVTQTDDHGLVSIFESVDCTLYHYIHEQGERISIQSIAKCVGRLSDALRHSHVLGYVHSAISSHCVYLASSGIVKLGGWELAMHVDKPKPNREYEERLRNEIFRWQAPELFHVSSPCKASDVYGLAMLLWEMSAMEVPWKGYSRVDVERQYAQQNRGVCWNMYMYDFPPLLRNLLEAALQIDVNKRTLDMNRMRRFLQRLEMQYEGEEPVYVEKYTNNNNMSGNTYILPKMRSCTMKKREGSKLTKSVSTKQLFVSNSSESPTQQLFVSNFSESPTKQYLKAKKLASKSIKNVGTTAHIEPVNIFDDDIRRSSKDSELEKLETMNVLHNIQTKYKKRSCSHCTLDVTNTVQNEDSNSLDSFCQSYKKPFKITKAPQESTDSWVTSVCTPASLETTDEESFKDAMTNLKQLKKDLADKREHFFYGSDSSQSPPHPTDQKSKKKTLVQDKSRNYEPHKPASHKTSIQPKYNKSPGQYDSSCMKSSSHQYRKVPYSHVPMPIKEAIVQPQVLNSDPQSFFETSLWRKEKLICLAKMRKSYGDDTMTLCAQNTDDNTTISTITSTKNTTVDSNISNSLRSDDTYVINRKPQAIETEASHEGYTAASEDTDVSADTTLQVLKDALDRATNIVRSATPNSDTSCQSPLFKNNENFDVSFDNGEAFKSMFEELYNLNITNNDEEIRSIEKSTPDDMFLFTKEDSNLTTKTTDNNRNTTEPEIDHTAKTTDYVNQTQSFNSTFTRNFVCESILEVSSEVSNSCSDTKLESTWETYTVQDKTVDSKKPSEITCSPSKAERTSGEYEQCPQKNEEKLEESNLRYLFLKDSTKTKDCNSCHHKNLPRRRSLPAALGQLRLSNSSVLSKLPIRRGDVPDNAVEDLYIDDEFGNSLTINMRLLSSDDDFLSDLSDLDITKE